MHIMTDMVVWGYTKHSFELVLLTPADARLLKAEAPILCGWDNDE